MLNPAKIAMSGMDEPMWILRCVRKECLSAGWVRFLLKLPQILFLDWLICSWISGYREARRSTSPLSCSEVRPKTYLSIHPPSISSFFVNCTIFCNQSINAFSAKLFWWSCKICSLAGLYTLPPPISCFSIKHALTIDNKFGCEKWKPPTEVG